MIDVALYANGGRVLTVTPAQRLVFSHNRQGPEMATAFFPGSLVESFRLRNMPGLMELIISAGADVLWRGRVEDRAITNAGLMVGAAGVRRVFSDLRYTALWSATGTANWKPVTDGDISTRKPEQYTIDNNNRLHLAIKKGEVYGNTIDIGELTYAAPHGGARSIVAFSASYSVTLPTNWQCRLLTAADDFSSPTVIGTITGNNAEQTGTINQTFTGAARLLVQIRNNTGSAYTATADTGDWCAKLTGIRTKTTTAAAVLASNIATALCDYVDAVNAGQITGKMVTATTNDLHDELYEDASPAEILDSLALRESRDWGVDVNGVFYFQPRNDQGRTWYVDIAGIELEDSTNELTNSVYATYRDANGRAKRTATSANNLSVQIAGLTRQDVVIAATTDATEAAAWRDARLTDGTAYALRATVEVSRILDTGGNIHRAYDILPGDSLIIRNLPQTLATDIDILSSISVARVEYDAETGAVAIEPDTPTPTLVTLVARSQR